MNRSDLVIRLSTLSGMTLRQTEVAVDHIFSTMSDTLASGYRIEIRGFGSFDLSHRPARIARNPRTGETFPIAGKYFPTFKAGKFLREMLSHNAGRDRTLSENTDAAHLKKSMRIQAALKNVIQNISA